MILLTIPGGHPWTVRTLPRNFVAWKWGAGEFADGKDGLTISQGLCQGWREVGWVVSKKNPKISLKHTPGSQKKKQMNEIPTYIHCWLGVWGIFQGYVGKFFRLLLSSIWVKVILRVAKRYLSFFCFCSDFYIFWGSTKKRGFKKNRLSWGEEVGSSPTRKFTNSTIWGPQRESQHGPVFCFSHLCFQHFLHFHHQLFCQWKNIALPSWETQSYSKLLGLSQWILFMGVGSYRCFVRVCLLTVP